MSLIFLQFCDGGGARRRTRAANDGFSLLSLVEKAIFYCSSHIILHVYSDLISFGFNNKVFFVF